MAKYWTIAGRAVVGAGVLTGSARNSEGDKITNDGNPDSPTVTSYNWYTAYFLSDQASAANGAVIQSAPNEAGPWVTVAQVALVAAVPSVLQVPALDTFHRVAVTNGATPATITVKDGYLTA